MEKASNISSKLTKRVWKDKNTKIRLRLAYSMSILLYKCETRTTFTGTGYNILLNALKNIVFKIIRKSLGRVKIENVCAMLIKRSLR